MYRIFLSEENKPFISDNGISYKDFLSPRITSSYIFIGVCILVIVLDSIYSVLGFCLQWQVWKPPASIILFLGGFSLILGVFYCLNTRFMRDKWREFVTQPDSIYWSENEFNHQVWTRYVEEEYGENGRSTHPLAKKIMIIVFICLLCTTYLGTMTLLAIKMGGYEPIDIEDLSQIALAFIIAVPLGIPCTYLAMKEIVLSNSNRAKAGQSDFILNKLGFVWLDTFTLFDEPNHCTPSDHRLEDIRVDEYNNLQHPCFEICTSRKKKGTIYYSFYRIPIPEGRMVEAQNYLKSHGYGKVDQECWSAPKREWQLNN